MEIGREGGWERERERERDSEERERERDRERVSRDRDGRRESCKDCIVVSHRRNLLSSII